MELKLLLYREQLEIWSHKTGSDKRFSQGWQAFIRRLSRTTNKYPYDILNLMRNGILRITISTLDSPKAQTMSFPIVRSNMDQQGDSTLNSLHPHPLPLL